MLPPYLVNLLYRAHRREKWERWRTRIEDLSDRLQPHLGKVAAHIHRYHWHAELAYLVSVLTDLRVFEQVAVSLLAIAAVIHIATDWT